jgi:hypothetical protein
MGSLEQQAGTLARRAAALSDPSMRVAYVRHQLQQFEPGEVADLILVVASRAEARDEACGTLMLAISLALADPALQPFRRSVVRAAASQGQHDVTRLLDDRAAAAKQEENHPVPDLGFSKPPTLGERKALARRPDRELIARIVRDPHPSVIEILLGNPALTEDDLVRMCSRRPIPPDVLREVFRSPRWIVRYRVRRTLVRNPYCPLDVALQLVTHLNAQDARAIADSTDLPDEVRRSCRRVAGDEVRH